MLKERRGRTSSEAMEETDREKRKRVSKACDLCRSRKLKCDGGFPTCARCTQSQSVCSYNHQAKKRRRKSGPSGSPAAPANGPVPAPKPVPAPESSLTDLDRRMSRVESMISALVGKLDPQLAKSASGSHEGGSVTDDSFSTAQSPLELHVDDDAAADHQDSTKLGVHHKYFGSQSTFSVLSAKGLVWLGKRSGDPDLLTRFQSFHRKTAGIFLVNNKRWIDPIEKRELSAFPDRETAKSLLDCFYDDFCFSVFVMSKEEINDLFDNYYRALAPTPGAPKARRLTNSDFLAMSVVIAQGSQFMLEEKDSMMEAKVEEFKNLQTKMTENAIYYYNRVSVISEGLRTVQAIMLFNFFTEFTRGPPHNYMLVATMVRYAQEMGLHRRESLVGLSPEEAMLRRRIWLMVYIFDRECCLMSGKPPIIDLNDVSSVLPHEIEDIVFEGVPREQVERLKNVDFDVVKAVVDFESSSQVRCTYSSSSLVRLTPYYHIKFVQFTSVIYQRLFSAQALRGKTLNQVLMMIEESNAELEVLKNTISKSMRPGVSLNSIKSVRLRYDVALLHFHYHSLSMIINRLAFTRAWLNDDSADGGHPGSSAVAALQFKLMNKCLDTARSIVRLVDEVGPFHSLFTHFVAFQFFSAFFTLFTGCLEFPKSPHFKSDIDLVFRVSDALVKHITTQADTLHDSCTYNVIAYSVRFFLRVAILVHNNESETKIDTKTLDAEMAHYDRIITDMSLRCNMMLREDDPLSVQPPKPPQPASSRTFSFDPVRSITGRSSANGASKSNSHSPQQHIQHQQMQQYQQLQVSRQNQMPPQQVPVPQSNQMMSPQQMNNNNPSPLFDANFPSPAGNSSTDEPGFMRSMEMFDNDRSTNILQQVFALPNFYLSAADMESYNADPNLMF